MRNLIRRILREENEKTPKAKLIKLIENLGIVSVVKLMGMDNILDVLDTEPINLINHFLIDKNLSTKNLGIATGGYDFNFMITDIDWGMDDTWTVYVKILNGKVTLILIDGETYDLWDSDLWEKDFWWEIQDEIKDIIYEYIEPLKPNEIELQITHNLE